jgi:hypothetical protein
VLIHATFMHLVYIPALAFCDMCTCEKLKSYVDYLVTIIYHVTYLILAYKVVLPCLTSISYKLCFLCTNLHVLSYEYTLLAWNT